MTPVVKTVLPAGNLIVDPFRTLEYIKLHPDAPDLRKAYDRPAGLDVAAHMISESGRHNQMVLPPGNSRIVPTGIVVLPPPGYLVLVCSRSGIATKAVFVANAPGIIDPDYTGELKIILFNGSHQTVYIKHGDYCAQLILTPLVLTNPVVVGKEKLSSTARGDKGFGSTG